ncbi:MAG: hypothetical protein Q8R13_03680 [bacterium]|nr:hypothetical protein [bacterium]MDZ4295771.1 hypothetical protein [Patescibacteria group bacterium]
MVSGWVFAGFVGAFSFRRSIASVKVSQYGPVWNPERFAYLVAQKEWPTLTPTTGGVTPLWVLLLLPAWTMHFLPLFLTGKGK